MISLGIEQLLTSPPESLTDTRLGLLCNQASTDQHLRHSRDLIMQAFPGQLTCLFSPQHGFFSEKQDNMVESDHMIDTATGLKIFSLYGDKRQPDQEMFDNLDVLLIDLSDIGTRVYTFIYTMAYCLESAARYGKKVLVLDRPNPLGGLTIEGNLLQPDCSSFVGLYPLPMRHGLTIGEIALFFNKEIGLHADLEIIAMRGWQRQMTFKDTGLPWIFPSPNMPGPTTALVYPGQVLWEGSNISEGRGTTLPFELFGAPFFKHDDILARVKADDLPGCHLRPLLFEPTANKWAGQPCTGFQIHIDDPAIFRPYRTSLLLLQSVMELYPDDFNYKPPPYEYEHDRLPLDLIIGNSEIRKAVEQGVDIVDLEKSWQDELQQFNSLRKKFFLYD